jgi:SAM-dependent methyltransferase
MRLHVGSGPCAIPGWLNLDLVPYPGVDVVLDVREGLPFTDATHVFAEHFIEHLSLEEGVAFLRECRRVLRDDGVLRLSTPNLDWIWLTHYRPPETLSADQRLYGCLELNRAFHGWGHRFLYNQHTLTLALRAAGFDEVVVRSYGESEIPELRDLERHERHADLPDAPSVLVLEATGRAARPEETFEEIIAPYVLDAKMR